MKSSVVQRICMRHFLSFCCCICFLVSVAQAQNSENAEISGMLRMMDDITPHVAVVVQAVNPTPGGSGEPTVAATTLSDEFGSYQFTDLKPGPYQIRCYTLSGYVYYKDRQIVRLKHGMALDQIVFRFPPFKKGKWSDLTYLDGLSANNILGIHSDADGVMWFVTTLGVSRYDGHNVVSLNPKEAFGSRLLPRNLDDVMWTSTAQECFFYDGTEFVTFTTEDGLASPVVNDILIEADGTLWFATMAGVSRYDGKEFVNYTTADGLMHDIVRTIERDPDGVMWFGTAGGISRYDGQAFVNFTEKDGLVANNIYASYRESDGTLWFATERGVSRYDRKRFINFTTANGLVHPFVYDIYVDPSGVVWLATSGGVSRYDGEGFVNLTVSDGLLSDAVKCIHRDSNGAMWFGTADGVSRYEDAGFSNFTTQDGLESNYIHTIYRALDGAMWLGTRGGAARYDGRRITAFTTADGLASNEVYRIYQTPDGIMWFGTGGGLSRYDGEEFVTFTRRQLSTLAITDKALLSSRKDALANNGVNAISGDLNGGLWLGLNAGIICRYDGKAFSTLWQTGDGTPVQTSYREPDGTMWFGTGWYHKEGGVLRYDGDEFQAFTTADGLAHYVVHSIYGTPDGSIWFGTGGGVSRFDGKTWMSLTKADGLSDNDVRAVYSDSDGMLWFGTSSGGVSGYDGIAWTTLDTRDGLAGNKVKAIYQDSDGYLWFGTSDGLTRYQKNTTRPQIRIAFVKTAKVEFSDLQSIPSILTGQRVTVAFDAVDFKTVPEKRQYRYRIKELDENWSRPKRENSIDIIFDTSGAYTVDVQAIDRDLNYSEPVSVLFEVLPPWYLNAWIAVPSAGVILILLITSTVYGTRYYAQRLQAQRLREQMLQREKMAALGKLTAGIAHEINTPIGAIKSNTDVATRCVAKLEEIFGNIKTVTNGDEYQRFLEILKENSQASSTASDRITDIVSSLKNFARLDKAEFEKVNIHEGLNSAFTLIQHEIKDGIEVVKKYGEIPEICCYASELNQVYMTLLRNAVQAIDNNGTVTLITSADKDNVCVKISDSGKGIPPEKLKTLFDFSFTTKDTRVGMGMGLVNAYNIIQKNKGELKVESKVGDGSTFTIVLPRGLEKTLKTV